MRIASLGNNEHRAAIDIVTFSLKQPSPLDLSDARLDFEPLDSILELDDIFPSLHSSMTDYAVKVAGYPLICKACDADDAGVISMSVADTAVQVYASRNPALEIAREFAHKRPLFATHMTASYPLGHLHQTNSVIIDGMLRIAQVLRKEYDGISIENYADADFHTYTNGSPISPHRKGLLLNISYELAQRQSPKYEFSQWRPELP